MTSEGRPTRPMLASAAAVLLLSPGGTTAPAPADIGDACPGSVAMAEFADVEPTALHARSIDCVAHWGIDLGEEGTFSPERPASTVELDDALTAIRALASGSSPSPDVPTGSGEPLTRGRLAGDVVDLLEELSGAPLPPRPHEYVDLDDSAWTSVSKVVGTGIVPGLKGGRFDPHGVVTRGAMATFVARTLDHLVEEGIIATPEGPSYEVPPGRVAHLPLPQAPEGTYHLDVPTRADGTPARFNPCATVAVVANLEGAPARAEAALRSALRRVSQATGVTWAYEGRTDERLHDAYARRAAYQPRRYGHRWAPVLVNWPERWDDDETLGLGGSRTIDGEEIVTGEVRLNPRADLDDGELLEVLMHELAHVAGLGHVDEAGQVMRRRLEAGSTGAHWGEGDLAALARVGRGQGCFQSRPPG